MKNTKIGIIGGGQLGLLLTQSAITFPAHVSVYDPNENCPATPFTHLFMQGGFDDYEKIVEFGKDQDVLIFETEKTDVKALFELEKMGKKIVSSPTTLQWIQDKGLQKQKLQEAGLPTSDFQFAGANEVRNYSGPFPIVQKWRTGGYDGYGVQIHKNQESIQSAQEVDSIFEEKIEIDKEISVIVVRNKQGDVVTYPPVEMVFDPTANLVDYLIAPARLDKKTVEKLNEMCKAMAEKLEFVGLYAIELFIDEQGNIYINEIAPRPHNSGHHTIAANVTSQYEQQIRVALGLPLGSTKQIHPCVMLNLLADDSSGPVSYEGLEQAYQIPNVQYYIYGKTHVRPSRKMGHALILEDDLEIALKRMEQIRNTLTITSHGK